MNNGHSKHKTLMLHKGFDMMRSIQKGFGFFTLFIKNRMDLIDPTVIDFTPFVDGIYQAREIEA